MDTDTAPSADIPALLKDATSAPKDSKQTDDLVAPFSPQGAAHAQRNPTSALPAIDAGNATSAAREAQFAQANHARLVAGIQGSLLPGGGSMHLRLEPPELGAIHVHVEMRDGVMTASFETSNDQATKLLSHSLGDLKTALESQGVSIEKLHVTQAPKQQSSTSDNRQGDKETRQDPAQQEQQRKEMLRRMWRKLMNGQDPIDMVA